MARLMNWMKPTEGSEMLSKSDYTKVWLKLTYDGSTSETAGRAYLTEDDKAVFADRAGWCTQYVTAWKPIEH